MIIKRHNSSQNEASKPNYFLTHTNSIQQVSLCPGKQHHVTHGDANPLRSQNFSGLYMEIMAAAEEAASAAYQYNFPYI